MTRYNQISLRKSGKNNPQDSLAADINEEDPSILGNQAFEEGAIETS